MAARVGVAIVVLHARRFKSLKDLGVFLLLWGAKGSLLLVFARHKAQSPRLNTSNVLLGLLEMLVCSVLWLALLLSQKAYVKIINCLFRKVKSAFCVSL